MSAPQQAPAQPPAEQSQAAQAALAVLVAAAIAKLWPSLDLLHLRQSLPAFKAAVAQEVQRHARASATLAARQYRDDRVRAGVGGGFTPAPADPPTVEQIAQAVDWAVQPLWDTSVPLSALGVAPPETEQAAGSAIADAKARVAAASEKLVLDTGRDTIISNVQRDRKAKGWARVAEPDACYFCAMLAARGAVYRSEKSASFQPHDHDRCHVEPMFQAYEPPARVRQWQALYDDTARRIGYGTDGRVTAKDMRRAFRQAYEGRPVDVTPSGQRDKSKPRSAQPQQPAGRTQEQIRAELTALENKLPSLTESQPREWMTNRITALRKQLGE